MTLVMDVINTGEKGKNMHKYFERRRAKRIKKWEAEFDREFMKFMREEKLYAK